MYPRLSQAWRFTSTKRPSRSCTKMASAACSTRRLKRSSLLLSASSRSLFTSDLPELALDGGAQPAHVLFGEVVVGPGLHDLHRRVLPHLAGDDDERDVRVEFPQQLQGRGGPEAGHVVVGDDYLEGFVPRPRPRATPPPCLLGYGPSRGGARTRHDGAPAGGASASFSESSTSSTRRVLAAVERAFLVRASRKFGLLRRGRAVPLVPAP